MSFRIVRFLLDAGPFDMNQLALMDFAPEEREQFAQLIGYSLSGFGELSYVSEEAYSAADRLSDGDGETEEDARLASLRETLDRLRDGMRKAVADLYAVHQDDLMGGE